MGNGMLPGIPAANWGVSTMPACVGVAMAKVSSAASAADWSPAAAVAAGPASAWLRRRLPEHPSPPSASSSVGCIAMFDSGPISQSTFGIAAVPGEKVDVTSLSEKCRENFRN